MDFCTLGMFIIDEIHSPPPQPPVYNNIIGGAGTFAALGARLFRQPPSSRLVSFIVHEGSDFPPHMKKEIESWKMNTIFIDTPDRKTTKGVNEYRSNGNRGFYYSSPKERVDPGILGESLIGSKTFHLICKPERCITLVKELLEKRSAFRHLVKPIFVWEPVPDSCKPSELSGLYEALKYVDVVSPNLVELQALFGKDFDENEGKLELLEEVCDQLLAIGFGNKPSAVVVRLGALGCYVAQAGRHASIPAYHRDPSDLNEDERKTWTNKVVDPTGAGNAFLGGYCIGLIDDLHSRGWTDFEAAAIYGSVAASFFVEQVGMPKLSRDESTKQELWNGEAVRDRLTKFDELLDCLALSEAQIYKISLFEDTHDEEGVVRVRKIG